MIRAFLLAAPAALLAACQVAPAPSPPPPAAGDCPILGSSDWAAWVDVMPGPNANPRLIVTGKVTVPTGGYRFEWGDFRVAESYPVQVFGELRAIPPGGPATQAVTTHDVRGEWSMSPPVGSLSISCGDRALARIAPVETAH